jgi:hypothetical protein
MSDEREYVVEEVAMIVMPAGSAISCQEATAVRIRDEGTGPFVVVSQSARGDGSGIAVTAEDWPAIKQAVEQLMKGCQRIERMQGGRE